MRKLLFIVANKDFKDEEYFIPKEIMQNNEIEIITSALEPQEAVSIDGKKINVDFPIKYFLEDKERLDTFDGIVLIGGPGMQLLANDEQLQQLAAFFASNKKLVAAICIAPLVLANAGILSQRDATIFPDSEAIDTLIKQGAEYLGQDVVVDNNIITASGPKAVYKFASRIVNYFRDKT